MQMLKFTESVGSGQSGGAKSLNIVKEIHIPATIGKIGKI